MNGLLWELTLDVPASLLDLSPCTGLRRLQLVDPWRTHPELWYATLRRFTPPKQCEIRIRPDPYDQSRTQERELRRLDKLITKTSQFSRLHSLMIIYGLPYKSDPSSPPVKTLDQLRACLPEADAKGLVSFVAWNLNVSS